MMMGPSATGVGSAVGIAKIAKMFGKSKPVVTDIIKHSPNLTRKILRK